MLPAKPLPGQFSKRDIQGGQLDTSNPCKHSDDCIPATSKASLIFSMVPIMVLLANRKSAQSFLLHTGYHMAQAKYHIVVVLETGETV